MDALSNLGIDFWSLLLYLVNVGLLILVLGRFLYRPLIKYLDQRRETVKRNIEEAEALKQNFQAELERQEQKTKELVEKMEQDIAASHQAAEKQAKQLLEDAEAERARLLDSTRIEIAKAKSQIHQEIEQEVVQRMYAVLATILKRTPSDAVLQSAKNSWEELKQKLR